MGRTRVPEDDGVGAELEVINAIEDFVAKQSDEDLVICELCEEEISPGNRSKVGCFGYTCIDKLCYNALHSLQRVPKDNPKLAKGLRQMASQEPQKFANVALKLRAPARQRKAVTREEVQDYVEFFIYEDTVTSRLGIKWLSERQFKAYFKIFEGSTDDAETERMWKHAEQHLQGERNIHGDWTVPVEMPAEVLKDKRRGIKRQLQNDECSAESARQTALQAKGAVSSSSQYEGFCAAMWAQASPSRLSAVKKAPVGDELGGANPLHSEPLLRSSSAVARDVRKQPSSEVGLPASSSKLEMQRRRFPSGQLSASSQPEAAKQGESDDEVLGTQDSHPPDEHEAAVVEPKKSSKSSSKWTPDDDWAEFVKLETLSVLKQKLPLGVFQRYKKAWLLLAQKQISRFSLTGRHNPLKMYDKAWAVARTHPDLAESDYSKMQQTVQTHLANVNERIAQGKKWRQGPQLVELQHELMDELARLEAATTKYAEHGDEVKQIAADMAAEKLKKARKTNCSILRTAKKYLEAGCPVVLAHHFAQNCTTMIQSPEDREWDHTVVSWWPSAMMVLLASGTC